MNAILNALETSSSASSDPHYLPDELLAVVEGAMHKVAELGGQDLTWHMATQQLCSRGKRVRARLALHACAAFGVRQESAVAWASAIELIHNATLVHDDAEDGDTIRRGRPTIWAQFGVSQAINTGDYLLMLPFLALRDLPAELQGALSLLIAEYCTKIVRGQVDDIEMNLHHRTDRAEFLRVCEGKTGALLALPVVGAAVLGGLSHSDAHRFAVPFVQLGVLFQLQDDVVDLFGDKGRGCPGGDIYEGKVSALLVALMERDAALGQEVKHRLAQSRQSTTAQDVAAVRRAYVESGALAAVLESILQMRGQVLKSTLLRSEPRLLLVATTLCQMAMGPIEHLYGDAQ